MTAAEQRNRKMRIKLTDFSPILCAYAFAVCVSSCVYVDDNLGENFIPINQQYDVYTMEFPLEDIRTEYSDSLSGFSSTRITVGAVRDPETGLTTRASAFTLIPLEEEMDFGKDPEILQFHFTAVRDTLSFPSESEDKIIQNIRVYELTKDLGSKYIYTSSGYWMEKDGVIGGSICRPFQYAGGDSLSFDFTPEYGQKYLDVLSEKFAEMDSLDKYTAELPGILITADEPVGNGGRINMFGLELEVAESYYVSGNYAELKFSSEYDGERRDTSFLFYFGAQSLTYSESGAQYALNVCRHEGYDPDNASANVSGAGAEMAVEGGGGPKPVVSAKEIHDKLLRHFESHGIDIGAVVINKASLILPFDDPALSEKRIYPTMLSPTCRLKSEVVSDEGDNVNSVYYAGLTDASVSTENHGDVNWSLLNYAPDITHHVQEVIKLDDDADFSTRDIWLLIMATETVTETTDNSAMNEYMQNLLYNSYYNNLYGYGYGGYGYGYGGYYDYSNYYNYYMMAAMMSNASQPTTTSETQLDKDRYYTCRLRGPEADTDTDKSLSERRVPMMQVTYSVPKEG